MPRTQRLGAAWVERHGGRWRNRRGAKLQDALTIDDAMVKMRALLAERAAKLADAAADSRAGVRDRGAATFGDAALDSLEHGRGVTGWRPSTLEGRPQALDFDVGAPGFLQRRGGRRSRACRRQRGETP